MKIEEVVISLVPSSDENVPPVLIKRGKDKMWVAISEGRTRGLFPGEVRLVNAIQERIIESWARGGMKEP